MLAQKRLSTYAINAHQVQSAKEWGLSEVILDVKGLSRFAKNDIASFQSLASLAKSLDLKVMLEWDILMTENNMQKAIELFNSLDLSAVDAIRVQDIGAIEYIFQNTDKPMQLIAEGKNHNLLSLKTYEKYLGNRLERIILSLELTKDKLKYYQEELASEVEFLVLGRILLFYTPRNLLSALDMKEYEDEILALGESEESPHKGFPLIENEHGTFMFHIKHQYLIDNLDEIDFINYLRVDFRFDSEFSLLKDLISHIQEGTKTQFKELYPFDTIRGFFKINKSNVLFKKLKNQRVQREDSNYIGVVIDAQKPSHLVLHIKDNALKAGETLIFKNPEGKEISLPVNVIKLLDGQEVESAKKGDFVQIKYHSQVWVKSQAYK
tara:strand:+ start:68069 stop:69208 length:1140 start_codon:yes stop_codon:yes gene_type:complete